MIEKVILDHEPLIRERNINALGQLMGEVMKKFAWTREC